MTRTHARPRRVGHRHLNPRGRTRRRSLVVMVVALLSAGLAGGGVGSAMADSDSAQRAPAQVEPSPEQRDVVDEQSADTRQERDGEPTDTPATPQPSQDDPAITDETSDGLDGALDLVQPLAAGPDGPGVQAPYIYWRAVESGTGTLVPGASFDLQRRTTSTTWGAAAVVSDCVSAPCTGLDRDPDPGEFLVMDHGSHRVANGDRYRIRRAEVPTGHRLGSTAWVEQPGAFATGSGWSNGTYRFGDVVFEPFQTISCAPDHVYSVSSTGSLVQVVNLPGNNSSTRTTIGTWGSGRSSVNSLAIGADGEVVYAIDRAGTSSVNVGAILRYTPATDEWVQVRGAYTTGNNRSLVAGAVNLADGRFLFGGYHDLGNSLYYRIHEFDPVTNQIRYVGQFNTGEPAGAVANGDMAFDSAGNLYVVRGGTSAVNIYTVTAETLAAANGGTLVRSATNPMTLGLGAVNGIAFEADGTIYLGNGSNIRQYDPATWQEVSQVTNQLSSSTDLASCSSPANLSVQKDVVSRVSPADQFTLAVSSGATQVAEVTTAGSATGIQIEQIGPIPVVTGSTYSISESMASGSAADYSSSYVCTSGGVTISSGSGTSGTVTIPNVSGASVACVFTNAPLDASLVVAKQWVLDGATPLPDGHTDLPEFLTDTARLSIDGTDVAWGQELTGVSTGDVVRIDESVDTSPWPPGCTLTSREITGTGITGSASLAYDATLVAGSNEFMVTNTVDCTTTLSLQKIVANGDATADEWTLTATSGDSAPVVSGAGAASGEVAPDTPYVLAESGGSAIYVADGPWQCARLVTDGDPVPVTVADGVTVSVPLGEHVSCAVTNATAQVTLLKHVERGDASPESWELTATPSDAPQEIAGLNAETVSGHLAPTAANTFYVRPGHGYAIVEELAVGNPLAYFQIAVQRYTGDDPQSPDHASADDWQDVDPESVTVAAGEHEIYRFVNAPVEGPALPLTGGAARDAFLIAGGLVLALSAGLLLRQHLTVRRGGRRFA